VTLRWTTDSLAGIHGLNIHRSTSPDGPFERLNAMPIPPGSPGSYSDTTVWPATTFWYELRAVMADGSEDIVGAQARVTTGGSLEARLYAARPNPSAGSVALQLDVPDHSGPVRAAVYNVNGQLVKWLERGPMSRGRHTLSWNGTDGAGRPVSSGVYFCRASVGEWSGSKRFVLIR
jgi:hypothetical protein